MCSRLMAPVIAPPAPPVMTKDGKVYTQDNFQLLAALVAKAGLDNLQ